MPRLALLVLAVVGAAAVCGAEERNGVNVRYIKRLDDSECGERARVGDHVRVVHKGHYAGAVIDQNPKDDEGNPVPMPVVIGKNRILEGG